MKRILSFFSLLFFVVTTPLFAQETSVVGRIVVRGEQPGEVVVWLIPINPSLSWAEFENYALKTLDILHFRILVHSTFRVFLGQTLK